MPYRPDLQPGNKNLQGVQGCGRAGRLGQDGNSRQEKREGHALGAALQVRRSLASDRAVRVVVIG